MMKRMKVAMETGEQAVVGDVEDEGGDGDRRTGCYR